MSDEHPPKRRKIESKGLAVLCACLPVLARDPAFTTSNVLLAYPPLKAELQVEEEPVVFTNARDVTMDNLEFFKTLKGWSIAKLCAGAAFNGDLRVLKEFFCRNLITQQLYEAIAHSAVAADNLAILAYIGSFTTTRWQSYTETAAKHGAVKVLEIFAISPEWTLLSKVLHPKTIDWAFEQNVDAVMLEGWRAENFSLWLRAAKHSSAALERVHSLGAYCPLDKIYLFGLSRRRTDIMQWAYDRGDTLQDRLPAVLPANNQEVLTLLARHFGVTYSRTSASGWNRRIEPPTLSRKDYFTLFNDKDFTECGKPDFEFEEDDIWMYIDRDNLDEDKIVFLLSQGFPEEHVRIFFRIALERSPLSLCKFLYNTFPALCKLEWPSDLVLNESETNERWDWLNSLDPITSETAFDFANTAIQVGESKTLEWVLNYVDKEKLPELMEQAVDYSCEREWDISDIAKIYAKYPHFPADFKLTRGGVRTKENISFLVDNKIPFPPGFQPLWPDDPDFLETHLHYFGWSEHLPYILAVHWSEENLRRYWEVEGRLSGNEDSSESDEE